MERERNRRRRTEGKRTCSPCHWAKTARENTRGVPKGGTRRFLRAGPLG